MSMIKKNAYIPIAKDRDSTHSLVMTSALRELENDKLIIRKIYPEIPPKVEYSISILGKELLPAIYTLGLFGKKISSNSN